MYCQKKLLLIVIIFIQNFISHAQGLMVVYEKQLNFSRSNYILYVNDTISLWQYTEDLADIDTILVYDDGTEFHSSNVIKITTPEYDAYPHKNFVFKDKKNETVYFVNHGITFQGKCKNIFLS